MALVVLLLFLLPFLEIYVLIVVGNGIGYAETIILVLGLSVFGAYLLRQQGLKALFAAQEALARGTMPVEAMLDGAGLAVAGGLLIAPGLITDAMGFLMLVPPLRRLTMQWVFGKLLGTHVFQVPPAAKTGADAARPGTVIEGEFKRLDEP